MNTAALVLYAKVFKKKGTIHSIYEIREATIEDIAWVKAMNGTLPEKALEMLKKG